MELKKELPEVFEDFADARKQAFMNVKKVKDGGRPVIGVYCTFFPQELAEAFGASVVLLRSVAEETIPDAELDLPKSLCPLIKASYGFGKTDKCPFFYFSDLVVGETTCDGKKKMYEYMGQFKPVHIMKLPNSCEEDDIRRGIKVKNAERTVLKKPYSIMKADPTPISGMELLNVWHVRGKRADLARFRPPRRAEAGGSGVQGAKVAPFPARTEPKTASFPRPCQIRSLPAGWEKGLSLSPGAFTGLHKGAGRTRERTFRNN